MSLKDNKLNLDELDSTSGGKTEVKGNSLDVDLGKISLIDSSEKKDIKDSYNKNKGNINLDFLNNVSGGSLYIKNNKAKLRTHDISLIDTSKDEKSSGSFSENTDNINIKNIPADISEDILKNIFKK